jgi:putative inorganic carbon (hco3(-)) transporter
VIALFATIVSLLGLTLLLTGISLIYYQFRLYSKLTNSGLFSWANSSYTQWVRIGWIFLCSGFLLNAKNWLEAIIWGLLTLEAIFRFWFKRPTNQVISLDNLLITSFSSKPATPPTTLSLIILNKLGTFLDTLKPLWVALLLPFFLFFDGRYLIYALPIYWLLLAISGLACSNLRTISPLDLCLLIFLLLIPLNAWIIQVPGITNQFLGYLLAQLISLHTVLTWVRTPRRWSLTIWGFSAIGVSLAILTPFVLIQSAKLFPVITTFQNIIGVVPETVHKNVMGGCLVLIFPLSLGLGLSQFSLRRWFLFGLALFSSVIIGGALIFTQSRGAYLALVSALLIMALLAWRRFKWLLLGLLVIIGLSVPFWLTTLQTGLDELLQADSFGGIAGRLEIWTRAVYIIQDFPLTGIGVGNFEKMVNTFYPSFAVSATGVPHSHNLYLQVAVDLGLAGLVAFLSLLIITLVCSWASWQKIKQFRQASLRPLLLGCLGSFCALCTHGLIDAVTWETKPSFLAWAVFGLLAVSIQINQEET